MLTRRLGDWIAGLDDGSLPAEAVHAVKRCTLDWFAAALPGSVTVPATVLARALAEEIGAGRASLLPDGRRAGVRCAALVNGTAAHAVEFDDIYREAIYHPGAPVIAAALAAAQSRGLGGRAFAAAVIAGYEISNRIGRAVMPGHYEFWHTTGTAGVFGAAAAAARIHGLDGERTGHALASAASMAAGLQQAFRSDAMTKPLHAGRAAETGVLCAAGAAHGLTGAAGMLDGERGFGAAMGGANADWEAEMADLGEDWTIVRTTQKNHGCCGHGFAALDAVIALRAAHAIDPREVRAVRIGTYGKALEVIGNPDPASPYEAKFSLPYCAAAALVEGRVRLATFAPERLHDERVRALMPRVEIRLDADADAAFPGRRSAVVEIETAAGERFEHRAPTRKGDPENPLDDAELDDKFRELATPVLGDAAGALRDRIWRLDGLASMDALFPGEAADAAE